MKTTFIKSSCIFHKNVRSWGKIQVYSFFNHVLCLILEEKKHVQNLVSRDFSEKSGENSLLDLDLKSFWFRFPFSKKSESKKVSLCKSRKKSESQNFSVFTSCIKMKTLFELFKPLAGTCIQATSSSRLFPICGEIVDHV